MTSNLMNWYVLHTKPRHEKKVEKDLLSAGINAYCPVKMEIKFWSDRKKRVFSPVIPSMVFVKIDEKSINDVFFVNGVTRFMFWLGKRAIVRDEEIQHLKQGFNKSIIQNPKIGKKVELKKLGNSTGIVEKIKKNNIWVRLEDLGYKVKLETA